MTQEQHILNHLYERGSITPIEALHVYKCFRLAARINDLRRKGANIETIFKYDMKGSRYAEYRIRPETAPESNSEGAAVWRSEP